MSYTILSEQIFDTPEDDQENNDNNNDTESSLNCDYCKKPIGEWGIINIQKLETTKQITFLCSTECKRKTKWIKTCKQCGNKFDPYSSRKLTQKFCSRNCHSEFSRQKCGLCKCCGKQIEGFEKNKVIPRKYCSNECINIARGYRYETHYYCNSCGKWIQSEKAILINKRPTCPERSCNKNRLRMQSTKSILNQRRKQVKLIE